MTATIRRALIRDMPDRSRIIARIELRGEDSRLADGFSVTGEVYYPHGNWSGAVRHRNGREWDCGGCVHEELLKAFPQLAKLIDLHLSDTAGVPMHAEANSRYFYEGARAAEGDPHHETYVWKEEYGEAERAGKTPAEYGRATACKILRVDSIPESFDALSMRIGVAGEKSPLAKAWSIWIDEQRERWQKEADEQRVFVESLADTKRSQLTN